MDQVLPRPLSILLTMTAATPPAGCSATGSEPPNLDERTKKSFDFLQDATKQLITLATAILTFTITFLKDLADTAGHNPRTLMTGCWILLVLSTIFGLLVLLNLTGVLAQPSLEPKIYRGSIRLFSTAQLAAFALALLFALAFALAW